ncbi:MAG: type II toxin-antitoxin system RelE/ParE family toxin [Agathobacter sp.]|nr:type II toxin-antitoxin system RelE/ParE family toxin [Agathobacter sp.]
MAYNIVVTSDAEADLEQFIRYLIFDKKNDQAARSLLRDFEETIKVLSRIASALRYCDNPKLRELGYKRMHFLNHRYFMMFRIEEDRIIIDNIFHELQDYENYLV